LTDAAIAGRLCPFAASSSRTTKVTWRPGHPTRVSSYEDELADVELDEDELVTGEG
jgi:hypothetical protein